MTIEEFVDKYKAFFLASNMDVMHSLRGKWYLSAYIAEYNYYDCFVEFETLEELVDIILREQTFFMSCALERETEVPVFEKDTAEILTKYDSREIPFKELQYNLKAIVNSELGNMEFFHYLQEFLEIKAELANIH